MNSALAKVNYDPDTDWSDAHLEVERIRDELYNFLCTTTKQSTNMAKIAKTNYYSYTTTFDPVPCKETLLAMAWAYIQTIPGMVGVTMPDSVWMPDESFTQCSDKWQSTIDAYFMTYLASQLFEESPAYDSNFVPGDLMMIFSYYAFYGLFWVHSTYPNYVLGDDQGTPEEYGPCDKKPCDAPLGDGNAGLIYGQGGDPLWEVTGT